MKNRECICFELGKNNYIGGFDSIYKYEQFEKYINSLVNINELIETKTFRKWFWSHCYECSFCKKSWILVEPDFPFRGYFGKTEEYEKHF